MISYEAADAGDDELDSGPGCVDLEVFAEAAIMIELGVGTLYHLAFKLGLALVDPPARQ